MTRILLQYLLPILLPTLVFVAWVYLTRDHEEEAADTLRRVREGPWFWLIVGGFLLAAAGLVYIGVSQGTSPGGSYSAPHLEDGRIVPGRVE